jgi:dTDP-4-dehydrorhamnose reductase
MQRLLITGGTGFLGKTLIHHAHQQGFLVAATYFSTSIPLDTNTETYWLPLDIRDLWAIEEGVEIFQPDIIIHTAFRQNNPLLWEITAGGTRNVAQVCCKRGIRMIHLSSDVIFDGERTRPYTPADLPQPITAYGAAKADAERFVRDFCASSVIVRTSLIYDYPDPDRHTQFILQVADGEVQARLFEDEYRCPIYVHDLAAAVLEVIQIPYRGILHVAGAEVVSRYELGMLLAHAHGRDPSTIPSGKSTESPSRRPRNCALDITESQRLLQTTLRGVRDVLQSHGVAFPSSGPLSIAKK